MRASSREIAAAGFDSGLMRLAQERVDTVQAGR